jgi:hypothetical protein
MQFFQTAASPEEFSAVATHLRQLVESATKSGRTDFAARHVNAALTAARQSGDAELVRLATLAVIQVQERSTP